MSRKTIFKTIAILNSSASVFHKMKRKSKVIKTETKSPYFSLEIINNVPSKERINDALNKCITEVNDILPETKTQDIASVKLRTGKISKYFKSKKQRVIKDVDRFYEQVKS